MPPVDGLPPRDVLVFAGGAYAELRAALLADAPVESAAFVFARQVRTPGGAWRLVAHEVMRLGPEDYAVRTTTRVELPPEVVARAMQRARELRSATVLVHSHPHAGAVTPSAEDLFGESRLVPAFTRRVPGAPVARLILGNDQAHAALLNTDGSSAPLLVHAVGADVRVVADASEDNDGFDAGGDAAGDARFHRQALAFGSEGQRRVAALRVAVVGLGGTGSVVAQQLALLGVGALLFVDDDRLEATNLNRVIGARPADVGRAKVAVARDAALAANPDVCVAAVRGDVCDADVARRLLDADFFFCCTDSHGSRAVLTQLAYQYLLPGIDVGVAIHAPAPTAARAGAAGGVRVAGRVQMLAPGLACPLCGGVLDPEAVRRDLLGADARAADPYIVGAAVPQPAVVSINSAASSLAVTMFLSAVAGVPVTARHQRLRFDAGAVSPVEVAPEPSCPWCAPDGGLARGDSWPMPGRAQGGAA